MRLLFLGYYSFRFIENLMTKEVLLTPLKLSFHRRSSHYLVLLDRYIPPLHNWMPWSDNVLRRLRNEYVPATPPPSSRMTKNPTPGVGPCHDGLFRASKSIISDSLIFA